MNDSFPEHDALLREWQSRQPLKPDDEKRLWQKFRLEWNFHSNHIEGNTLTYGETELFFLHDRIQAGHTHREYVEMKAHDAAIEHVRELARAERLIGEGDIRDLNKIALKEPFWKDATTVDGKPSRKQVIPGEYKTTPNNVLTATGETFFFAKPEETPSKMQALVEWLRREMEGSALHPIEIAARCHHDFALIHPFDDGNGRVARLLVNYILLRHGFPPVIVRSEKKAVYLAALQQADAGNLAPLTEHLAAELRWSLETAIKAAKGESIQDPSDVEKEVHLFIRDQKARTQGKTAAPKEIVQQIYEASIKPFLEKAESKLLQLVPLFKKLEVRTRIGQVGHTISARIPFSELEHIRPGNSVMISFMFYSYVGEAVAPFNFETVIELHFPEDHYTVVHSQKVIASHPYSRLIMAEEAEQLTAQILASAFDRIKKKAEK